MLCDVNANAGNIQQYNILRLEKIAIVKHYDLRPPTAVPVFWALIMIPENTPLQVLLSLTVTATVIAVLEK